MSELFADGQAPRVATPEMKREALERELKYRRSVYRRRVSDGKMSKTAADYQIWIMERILAEGFAP